MGDVCDTVIMAKGLCCQSGRQYLLKDINWEIKRGEHWIVFGMNGSGKTTLLSIIAGYKKYTTGELSVLGQTYTNENILELRKKIGFVSNSFFERYYKQESVLDIVLSAQSGMFGLVGIIDDRLVRHAKHLLEELHLKDKISYPFALLSKGERQNVLIARALLLQPEILILDEPCTGLDLLAREHLQNTISELANKTNMTIIYVTHYVEEILPVMEYSLLLKHGHCWGQGETRVLFTKEKFSNFLGYPLEAVNRQTFSTTVSSKIYQLLGGDKYDGKFRNDGEI